MDQNLFSDHKSIFEMYKFGSICFFKVKYNQQRIWYDMATILIFRTDKISNNYFIYKHAFVDNVV